MGNHAEKPSPFQGEAGPEEQIRRRQTGVEADMIRPKAFPQGEGVMAAGHDG